MEGSEYDAIFTAIKRFGTALASSKEWLEHAEGTDKTPWRFSFLHEARRAHESAKPHLRVLENGLGPPGDETISQEAPIESLAPLDALQRNLAAMRASYEANEKRIAAMEAALVTSTRPIGSA